MVCCGGETRERGDLSLELEKDKRVMKKANATISSFARTASIVLMLTAVTATVSAAQTFTTLVNFDKTNGANPAASLIQGTDGNFYGTTYGGGANGNGTVFQITPAGTLTTLHSFDLTDGASLAGALLQGTDGNFYGTTSTGGATFSGTVFKITPGGTLTTLYSFCSQLGCPDGESPEAGLAQGTDGNFYGTTSGGGANKWGTAFKITPGGTLTTLYTFCSQSGCTDGAAPYGGLVQGTDGNFYGTTSRGSGTNLTGTVFKITPAGTLTTLYSFCSQSGCPDGSLPTAALVQGTDGNFHGTTSRGGANNSGTVFKITPGGTLTTLYSFCSQSACTDGGTPYEELVQGADGNFYGMTNSGGASGLGTVFEITLAGTLTTLHSFGGADGSLPSAGLVQAANGKFYGTTEQGGTSSNCGSGCGTVFSLELGQGGSAVTLSRTSLAFAKQVINTTSAAKNITVTNSGNVPVMFSGVTTSGNFAVSANTCAGSLAVGKKCKIGVVFTPTQLGPLTGTLTISDDAANSPQTVALSGTGVVPVTLTPESATYPTRTVGTTSPAKTFTLTNSQNITLDDIAIATTGDFAVSGTSCTTSLPAKGKCKISVTFTPTATGTRTGQLSVSNNASNSPQTASLTGTGK